jgi:hypothetical protein
MTLLPGTDYMSNSARTEAEMKVALDKVNEVIAEIGSKDVTTLIISGAGAITTPLSSMVSVMPEGSGVADTLSSIGVSNIDKGRMVILQHAEEPLLAANGITITHGTTAAAIEMLDGADFVLCAKRKICLIYTGATGHWKEVWRGYGRETESERAAERTDMGLGTASVETIAANFGSDSIGKVLKVGASALDQNDVLKIGVGGLIEAATISDNATTLGGQPASSFVRSNENQAQSIDNNLSLTSAGSTVLNTVSTGANEFPGLRIHSGASLDTAVERAQLYSSTADGSLTLRTLTAGGVVDPGITLIPSTIGVGATPGRIEFKANAASAAQSLTPGPGNGLNADLLDGHEWSDVHTISTSRTLRFNNVQQNTLADTSGGGSVITKFSDMPYPVTPNGVRRFLVSGRLIFHCVAADGFDSDRTVDTKFYSSTDTAAGLTGFIPGTNIETPTGVPDTYYIIQIPPRFYVPGVGESVTVRCGEFGDSQKMDLMTDIGYGAFSDSSSYVQINTTSAASRGRCWVKIEYCDR